MNTRLACLILGILAALLAWSAAIIHYFKNGDVNFGTIAAGLFFLSFGVVVWRRT